MNEVRDLEREQTARKQFGGMSVGTYTITLVSKMKKCNLYSKENLHTHFYHYSYIQNTSTLLRNICYQLINRSLARKQKHGQNLTCSQKKNVTLSLNTSHRPFINQR